MTTRLILLVFCAALISCANRASTETSCDSCKITRSAVAHLDYFAGIDVGAGVGSTPAGHILLLSGLSLLEFDSRGTLMDSIPPISGRASVEPYSSVTSFGADSLLLADTRLLRVLGPSRAQVDSVQLPANTVIRVLHVLRWPDRLMFSGHALGTAGLFMAAVRDGYLVIDSAFDPPDAAATVRAPA